MTNLKYEDTLTEEEKTYYDMCMKHDFMYEMSDDMSWYRHGAETYKRLYAYGKEHLSPDRSEEILEWVKWKKYG